MTRRSPSRDRPDSEHRPGGSRRANEAPGTDLLLGFHAVRAALDQNPRRVERVVLARGARDGRTRQIVSLARGAGVPFSQAPRAALDRISGGLPHQGIVGKLAAAELLSARALIETLPDQAVVIAIDGVNDPRNLGAILRSAAAFGVSGLFLPSHRSAGLGPAAARTAAGGLEWVPVARAGNMRLLLDELERRDLLGVALDPVDGVPPWEADLTGGRVLVAGGEEKGVRPSVRSRCPIGVRIPIDPRIGSLNVAVAVGIVLAEAARQRAADG